MSEGALTVNVTVSADMCWQMNVIRKNTFQNRKQHRLELSSHIVSRESEYTENKNVYKQCLLKKYI